MQKLSRIFAAVFLSILMLSLVPYTIQPAHAFSGNVEVKVTIKELEALDVIDTLDGADFFPEVRIDGVDFGGESLEIVDNDNPSPNWEFVQLVDFTKENIPIRISIFDFDTLANGGNDHIDLQSGHPDRNLDLTLNLATCDISLDVIGNCNSTLESSGSANDSAKITFVIEVILPASGPGLQIYCIHSPIWPQDGEDITITAIALDDNLKLKEVDKLEILITTDPIPASSVNDNFFTIATVDPSEIDFMYECRAEDAGSSDVDTDWRELDVGTNATPKISILSTGSLDFTKDIVFVPDSDNYSANDDTFLKDVEKAIDAYYTGGLVFLEKQDRVSFWISQNEGNAVGFVNSVCNHDEPNDWNTEFAFSDSGVILHRDSIRNCADSNGLASVNINTHDPNVKNIFTHELGHAAFGLADEYCDTRPGSESTKCDGGYWQNNNAPNIFNNTNDCQNDPNRNGKTCDEFVSQNKKTMGQHFFTYDPVKEDLMVDDKLPQALDIRRILHVFGECLAGRC